MAPVGAAVGPAPKIEALSQIGAGGVVGHAAAAWDEGRRTRFEDAIALALGEAV